MNHFVLNEAEITLPMFLEDFEQGKLKPIYTSEERYGHNKYAVTPMGTS